MGEFLEVFKMEWSLFENFSFENKLQKKLLNIGVGLDVGGRSRVFWKFLQISSDLVVWYIQSSLRRQRAGCILNRQIEPLSYPFNLFTVTLRWSSASKIRSFFQHLLCIKDLRDPLEAWSDYDSSNTLKLTAV